MVTKAVIEGNVSRIGAGAFVGIAESCITANSYISCGNCEDKVVQSGVSCVSGCYAGYTSYYRYCLRTRFTMPEADAVTSNDNENMIL